MSKATKPGRDPVLSINLLVPAPFRASVAEALLQAAIEKEADAAKRRKGSLIRTHLFADASGLRKLADEVRP